MFDISIYLNIYLYLNTYIKNYIFKRYNVIIIKCIGTYMYVFFVWINTKVKQPMTCQFLSKNVY